MSGEELINDVIFLTGGFQYTTPSEARSAVELVRKETLNEVKAKFMNCKGDVRRVGIQIISQLEST